MKRILTFFIATFLVAAVLISCSKNNDKKTLSTTPDATAANDSKSGGVYKGVIIGSSGILKIMLQNNNLSAELTIDGETRTLPATNLTNWSSGQAIVNAVFQKDDWKVTFSVNANGFNPQVKVEVPGHPKISVTIVKESSTLQVKAFEGTYQVVTGTQQGIGTWNFVSVGDSLGGIRKAPTDADVTPLSGTISNGQVSAYSGSASVSGTISGEDASGVWTDVGSTGTWKGKRTL